MAEYYKYQKYQKYINGVPADPPEYKQGELIGTGEYDSKADCESDAIYEWRVYSQSDYICDGYSSYYKEYKYKSLDNGQTWTRTSQTRKGALKSQYATECGWRLLERWVKTGVTRCNGDDLQDEYKKQVSYDMGKTYVDTNPPEFKYETAEGGEFYKDCVLKREPLVYEITTLEDNVGIWIELFQTSDKYYINWGESENVAEYKLNGQLIMLYDSKELGPNWWGCPKNYVFQKAGTYQVKVWVGSVIEFGGVFRTERWSDTVHFKGLTYTDKYTYKIKSWGGRPYSALNGFNFSNTPLTELCDDEQGMFRNSPLNSIGSATPNHYFYSIYHGHSGSADYTIQLELGAAFTVANTLLTEVPPNIFKYAHNLVQATFINTDIASIPDTLFSNCTGLQDINGAFEDCTKITSIPEGLFDGCPNLSNAQNAFANTGITYVPRLWHISSSINTGRMFLNCNSLVSIADDFGQLTGIKYSMFENCTELTSLGGLTLGRGIMDSMLANTKISELPANVWSNISNGYSAEEMFRDCKELKAVSGVITGNNIGSAQKMFYNSGITSVDIQFPDLLQSEENTLVEMFAYCKELNTVNNNMFNKDATALYPTRMFMGCVSLTEWIKDGDTNIWDYPAFYKVDNQPNHLQYTYMYLGCTQIMGQIPVEFGGLIMYDGLIPAQITLPITESTLSYKGLQLRIPANEKAIVRWEDDVYTLYQDENLITLSYTYKTPGDKHIEIYATQNVTIYYTNSIIPVDVNNFGTIKFDLDNNNIRLLGPTNGQYKAETQINIQGREGFIINPAHFTDCNNVNKFVVTKVAGFTGEFKANDWMPNLTDVTKCFDYSTINSYDGIFEGCQNIIDIRNFCEDLSATGEVTINRLFKGCTSLSTISSGTGSDTDGPFWFGGDKIAHTDEAFMNCTSLKRNYPTLGPTPKHYSDVREFCNSGIITASIYAPDREINHYVDWTECFKDCKDLSSIFIEESLWINGTLNMTRMFENCTSLTATPTYKGKKLWEWSGVQDAYGYVIAKQIIGTECFKGCTQLADYNEIPDNWK